MDWKGLVYEYAYLKNQMEAEYEPELIVTCVEDEAYWQQQKKRISRLREQHENRGLEPVRRQTRVRIASARPIHNHLIVELQLNSTFEYMSQGRSYKEEKKDTEALSLISNKGKWVIVGVSLIHQESDVDQFDSDRVLADVHMEPVQGVDKWGDLSLYYKNGSLSGLSVPLLDDRVASIEPYARGKGGKGGYDRRAAAEYADRWWESGNPAFLEFEVDCSNYVSQCIFAGGAPMNYTDRRNAGWWYRGRSGSRELWSYSWAVANSLRSYLAASRSGLRALQVETPQQLEEGDVICYSWLGDGRYGHSTVVAAIDGNGMPLVNAHTVSSKHRYWDYRDSYAWTNNTQYRFFHIADEF